MAERIYYTNPDQLTFEATITSTGKIETGDFVELDTSAFYPTSGGQLHDTGYLNDIRVVDVVETESGEVRHVVEKPLGETGTKVEGRVDADRRWRHRQQHTAQHILSQIFIRLYNSETVSVHLGEEYGAVELDTAELTPDQLERAEVEANRIVRESQSIEILFVTVDEARKLPLRKVPEREGTIRVIKTGELDWSACGGTHCRNTAQVGLIKIFGTEKLRGRQLVKFLAGTQALDDYRSRFKITDELARELTCHPADLPDKFARLTEESKAQRRRLTALQKQLLPVLAEELAHQADSSGTTPMVIQESPDVDPSMYSALAGQAAEKIDGVVVLIGEGRMVLAASEKSGRHAGNIVKQFCAQTGLRGGGSATIAQAGGMSAEVFDAHRSLLLELINA